MSTTQPEIPRSVAPAEITLPPEALRSSVVVRPSDEGLFGALIDHIGLARINYGPVTDPSGGDEHASQFVRIGWHSLEHRTPEDVQGGLTRIAKSFSRLMNGEAASDGDVYAQAYAFNALLFRERLANTAPSRQAQLQIDTEAGLTPYPGLMIIENAPEQGVPPYSIRLVPDLWQVA